LRQWVLSVPKRLRHFLGRDAELQGAALRLFLAAVEQCLRALVRPLARWRWRAVYDSAKPGTGAMGLRLTPLESLERLAALVPPPQVHPSGRAQKIAVSIRDLRLRGRVRQRDPAGARHPPGAETL
jgi:hypothetical protein